MQTRLFRLLMVTCIALGPLLAPVPAMAQAPPQVLLSGSPLSLPAHQQPLIMSGTTLVPMRAIFTALGAEVAWESETMTVTARKGDMTVVLQIGACAGRVNDREVALAHRAQLVEGTTYVPLRFVSEALGAQVGWDGKRRIVTIDWPVARATLQTHFAAAALEAAVRTAVGDLVSPLSAGDLARVTDLTVPAAGIEDLKGIEALANLRRLHLPDNRIRDITLLRNLEQLSDLDLSGNALVDLSPLKPLRRLSRLNVARNKVAEIAPLAGLGSLTGLTALTLDSIRPEDEAVLQGLTGLTRLRLARLGAGQEERLPTACSYMESTEQLPLRVETAHGVFLGDKDLSITQLLNYGRLFEVSVLPRLAQDTGLRPDREKALFQIYGSKTTWDAEAARDNVAGFYSSSRLYMAHWLYPDQTNAVLLAHEYLHWLVREVGRAQLPPWFDEGLAYNVSLGGLPGAEYQASPFTDRLWRSILQPDRELPREVPVLATSKGHDAYTITAVSALLQYHGGRTALASFFSLTRAGKTYTEAFTSAFHISPDDYQAEYEQLVAWRRSR